MSHWSARTYFATVVKEIKAEMKVSIIGTGYVGLTTGVCLGYLGHKVTCIDSDSKKIGMLQAGKTPIYEPFLTELMAAAQPNLQFCTDYAGAVKDADVIFIAVGTPPSPDGSPDLKYLRAAAQGIGRALRRRFSSGGEQIHGADRQRKLGGFHGARILRAAPWTQRPMGISQWRLIRNSCARARRCTIACMRIAW